MARAMRDTGTLPHGQKIAGMPRFFLGAADAPINPPPGWQPTTLAGKLSSGTQFIQTQFCMDIGVVQRYMARLGEAGLLDKLFLLIGVNPLRSARSARWMRKNLFGTIIPDEFIARLERACDPAAEGLRICAEFVHQLVETPGVAGIHVMAPGNEPGLQRLISDMRLSLPRKRQSPLGDV
jgi:methylenetetrahydrofolate reductase (NADPH)